MSNQQSNSEPTKYICYKMGKVMRKIQHYYESKLANYEITPVQLFVLSALWDKDGIKFKELAQKVSLDGSTLTGVLDRMERSGYIERKDDPEDRRSLLVFLTGKARQEGEKIMETAEELDYEIKKQLPEDEFNTFIKVLDRLSRWEC